MKINLHVMLLRYEGKPAERFFPFPLLESPCGECRTLFEGNIAANSSPRHDKEIDILSTLDRLFQRRPSLSWSDLKRILHFFQTEELQNFEQKSTKIPLLPYLVLLLAGVSTVVLCAGEPCCKNGRPRHLVSHPERTEASPPELCSLLC